MSAVRARPGEPILAPNSLSPMSDSLAEFFDCPVSGYALHSNSTVGVITPYSVAGNDYFLWACRIKLIELAPCFFCEGGLETVAGSEFTSIEGVADDRYSVDYG